MRLLTQSKFIHSHLSITCIAKAVMRCTNKESSRHRYTDTLGLEVIIIR